MGRSKTDFLFATPSFIGGAATILSIAGFSHEYNKSASEECADARALSSDWNIVGHDINDAKNALEVACLERDDD